MSNINKKRGKSFTLPLTSAQRKARQREQIRAWVIKQTNGEITTAEGYIMSLMKKERTQTK